jgi:cell division protein FtsQ
MLLAKRNRRKELSDAAKKDRFAFVRAHQRGFTIVASVVLLVPLTWGLLKTLDQPVRRIEVVGKFARVSSLQIEQAVAPFATRGLLSVDLKVVKSAIQTIAWVDHARVERSWPDGLKVFVTEQVAAARWGESGLLNIRGEMFLKDSRYLPPELPRLDGPDGTQAQVAKLYLDTYPRLMSANLRLGRVMLDARGAWDLVLTNGVDVRLGRQDVDARLQRFIRVASPMIATHAEQISYIDMRYSNGFAVGWNGAAPSTKKQEPRPNV